MRVTSTRPEGMRCFSLSAEGIEPVSSRASIFSAIVLPTPASSSARPCLPSRRRRLPPRGSPWRRCGRRRRGRRPRRRARRGSRAPRTPPLSRRCAFVTSLRAALPGAWLILPTYNEAENIEAMLRAALAQLASTGREHTILVVDDGSPDGTGQIADADGRRAPRDPGDAPAGEAGPRPGLPRRLRGRAGERRRADPRDGLRLLSRPRRPAAPDRGRGRGGPGARLALCARRRCPELGNAAAAPLARRLLVRPRAPRRAGPAI